jgi:AcrR family transcriptional regulator
MKGRALERYGHKPEPGIEGQPDREQALRADAQRNHTALIEAAVQVFRDMGVDAPMKDIAEKADVGVGTVYRRFPKRSDLIIAVFRHEVDACAAAADAIAADHASFDALLRWIDRYVELIVTKRGLAAALHSDEPAYESLAEYFEDTLVPPLTALLSFARDEIKVEVSPSELLRAVGRLCGPASQGDFSQTQRMVALLINGLRVPGP